MRVKDVELEKVRWKRDGKAVSVGTDVSKGELVMMARWGPESYERPWKAENPGGIHELVALLKGLGEGREMGVAMEPSGTYGDPLRQALTEAGIPVYRVSPKASRDYSEIFDGVPSQLDGKDCGVVAELHAHGKSRPWPYVRLAEPEEEFRYRVANMAAHDKMLTAWVGRIEGLLGRHWPEASQYLRPSSATLLKVLAEYGGPAGVAEAGEEAEKRIQEWGGHFVEKETAWSLVRSARETVGLKYTDRVRDWIREWAGEALEQREVIEAQRRKLAQLAEGNETIRRMISAVGLACACAIWVDMGDPHSYDSPEAFRKAMGLNLKVRESGESKGQLKLAKRGSARVRMYLYFAALRMLWDTDVKAWYERKVERSNGKKMGAIVAIMRKLALATHCVAVKGVEFDPGKLFCETKKKRPEKAGR
jgi:transposase